MTAAPEAPGREVTPIARPRLPAAAGTPPTEKAKARKHRRGLLGVWDTSIGKKYVMAVTGLLFVLFLLLHMLGNLKIFFGRNDFNAYAEWLRSIGTPLVHRVWYLWIQRFVLTAALVLHVLAAWQLSQRDRASRPVKYAHKQPITGRFTIHSMRWGGLALFLFIIWHILDLSAGTVASGGFKQGDVYDNVVHDFSLSHWYENAIYIVAMVALALHINHGFWSQSMTLGYNRPSRNAVIERTGNVLALVIGLGFILVPCAVMGGLVR